MQRRRSIRVLNVPELADHLLDNLLIQNTHSKRQNSIVVVKETFSYGTLRRTV